MKKKIDFSSKAEVIEFIENESREKITDKNRKNEIYHSIIESRKNLAKANRLGPKSEKAKAVKQQAVRKIHSVYAGLEIDYETLCVLFERSVGWFSINFKDLGLMRKSNIPRVPNHPTKYCVNEHAFSKWSRDSAYWLGFIWADGHVRNSLHRKHIRVVVQEADSQHLLDFKRFLKSDIPVNTVFYRAKKGGKYYPQSVIVINRKRMVESLIVKKVLINRSTENVEFPDIPNEFFWDFIRGYFDGDGAIFRAQKCKFLCSGWVVSFAGSETVLRSLKAAIRADVGIEMDFRRNGTSDTNFSLARSGPAVFKLVRMLYPDDDTVGLARKKVLARKILRAYDLAIEAGVSIVRRGDGYRFVFPKGFEFP